jgi:DNA-binding protein Fis
MLNPETAIRMIHDLVEAEVNVVKSCNTGHRLSKAQLRSEAQAARNIFRELTGSEPTDQELKSICDM